MPLTLARAEPMICVIDSAECPSPSSFFWLPSIEIARCMPALMVVPTRAPTPRIAAPLAIVLPTPPRNPEPDFLPERSPSVSASPNALAMSLPMPLVAATIDR